MNTSTFIFSGYSLGFRVAFLRHRTPNARRKQRGIGGKRETLAWFKKKKKTQKKRPGFGKARSLTSEQLIEDGEKEALSVVQITLRFDATILKGGQQLWYAVLLMHASDFALYHSFISFF